MLHKFPRQVVELALRAAANQLTILDRADARRVIAAVFEPLEAIEQPLGDIVVTDNPDNSAHRSNAFDQRRLTSGLLPINRGG
jgi:hypothetical protein